LVGADKGGVGKTTVSRVLTDYLEANKFDEYHAYDTEFPAGVLKRFKPNNTEIVDLTEVKDQMKVFDSLDKYPVTLVDVRAGLLTPTLQVLGDIGLLDMVKNGLVSLMVLHVLGPSVASLEEIEKTSQVIPGATHYLVKNHINATEFFRWDEDMYRRAFGASRSGIIEIPQLTEMAVENVELSGVSFTQFAMNKKSDGSNAEFSFVLRGYVKAWLKEVFGAFDQANINGIVGQAVTS
jgi:hypothetical protein